MDGTLPKRFRGGAAVRGIWIRPRIKPYSGDLRMLWTIAVILFVLWLLGFFVAHVGGGLIHLLLVIAVIVIVYRLITGRPVT